MSASPLRPKLSSGVITSVGGDRGAVVFQYNPEELTRQIEPQMVGGDGDHAFGVRFTGAPKETIEMQLHFDAIDGLERGDAVTQKYGVANRLARLELLAYPTAEWVQQRSDLLASGTIEILPDFAPLTMLTLGANRSLPVKIERLSISEQAFDTSLNPIRATVDVSFHVLTYSDVLPANGAYTQFLKYQQGLETMAETAPDDDVVSG